MYKTINNKTPGSYRASASCLSRNEANTPGLGGGDRVSARCSRCQHFMYVGWYTSWRIAPKGYRTKGSVCLSERSTPEFWARPLRPTRRRHSRLGGKKHPLRSARCRHFLVLGQQTPSTLGKTPTPKFIDGLGNTYPLQVNYAQQDTLTSWAMSSTLGPLGLFHCSSLQMRFASRSFCVMEICLTCVAAWRRRGVAWRRSKDGTQQERAGEGNTSDQIR